MRETKARSGLPVFTLLAALALSLALSGTLRAEDPIAETSASSSSDGTIDVNSTPDENSTDRTLIELNKVLVIPQKCSANDGMMDCDPNEASPAEANPASDSSATNAGDDSNSSSTPSADADFPDSQLNPVASEPASESGDDGNGGAVANAAQASPAAEASPGEPDISNPDTPLPDASAQGNPAVASNDPNAITPEYGSLEDYRSQQDATMAVPAPMYPGTVYGAGSGRYPAYANHPAYANPVGGAYAAARVYTPSFRPPFGPAGPWMTPPSAMLGRPGLTAAPMARPAGRSFGFHR